MTPETYQLADLTNFIRRVFALNMPEPVWVAAELAQVNESRGHQWLSLVQKDPDTDQIVAQMEGVVWATKVRDLRLNYGKPLVDGLFQQGMSVRIRVNATFHERFGLRLSVEDVDPAFTIGELERRRQLTLERLSAEDLLERNGRLPLALAPQRLAIISSDTAAGLADFRQQLEANPYGYQFKLKVFTAAMQGVQASPEIIRRLREIGRNWSDRFDAVVIVRGGGGRTDLAAFDEEQLCRAVAEHGLPVIVGIGHETDESVLDRIAHRSLKTPTAAAVFLIERLVATEGRVLQLGRRIAQSGHQITGWESPRLDRLAQANHQAARSALTAETFRTDRLEADLKRIPPAALASASDQLNHLEQLLTALRPETTLARGYALVSQEGRLIVDPDDVRDGELEVRLKTGRIKVSPVK
ncbi:exodeoxyribonuclease VII large subunit [Neolewinella aurantiaca]|uniref:exodeoxyribonuclease VII large subunit n=1 Tax=Neolewinella aurantiaca TaxID=2602767 RepID=UPI001650BA13|nr:exodeoxyribonuclease VII large subunit [Neolewinella aurantiaca]